MPHHGPRKIKGNALIHAIFCAVLEEVRESDDTLSQKLFVEIFKDKDAFDEVLVMNLRKVDQVEQCMVGTIPRIGNFVEEETADPGKTLNSKVEEVLNKFEGESLVVKTRYFKVFNQNDH